MRRRSVVGVLLAVLVAGSVVAPGGAAADGSGVRLLPLPEGGHVGRVVGSGFSTETAALGEDGTVAAGVLLPGGVKKTLVWPPGGPAVEISSTKAYEVRGVNGRGDVVMLGYRGMGSEVAKLWRGGVLTDLPSPIEGEPTTFGPARYMDSFTGGPWLTSRGEVVGLAYGEGGRHVVRWTAGSVESVGLGNLTAVNEEGVILVERGYSYDRTDLTIVEGSRRTTAVLPEGVSVMRAGGLHPFLPWVVGEASGSVGTVPFVWQR